MAATTDAEKDGRRELGTRGERLAAAFLERRGIQVIERNVRLGRGELDLVALEGGVVVFIEVKSNRGRRHGPPEEMVTREKQRRLTQLAARYLQRRRWLGRPARFDVIAVEWAEDGAAAVRHIRDAFPAAAWC